MYSVAEGIRVTGLNSVIGLWLQVTMFSDERHQGG